MVDNPYSPPKLSNSGVTKRRAVWSWLSSWPAFVIASFFSAWATFYAAYAENVFTTPYLEQYMGLSLFTVWVSESLIVATITCALVCVSLIASPKVGFINYATLGVSCVVEFGLVWFFFVAFFGI